MYRTRTYIAADWDEDKEVVDKLRQWNDSDYWSLSFTDAHDLTQARDTSDYCNIKRSLAERMNASKTFVLIVGAKTKIIRKGGCQYCDDYSSYYGKCNKNHYVDYRSYIEYECEKAKNDDLKIVVIYNYANVDKSKCPDVLKNEGTHIPAFYYDNGIKKWCYYSIKEALQDD